MRLPLLAVTLLITGCVGHQVRRSALVPAVTPPLRTGQVDNDRLASLTFGNSTFLRATSPVEVEGAANAGLYLPRTQFGLEATFMAVDNFELGPKIEIGLRQGADPIARDIPPPPDEPVVGFGPTMQYSIPIGRHFRLGLGLELLWTFAPYALYEDCPLRCRRVETGTDSVAVLGLSAIPSLRFGPVSFFAGIAGRNQPTNTRDEVIYTKDFFDSDNVTFGRMYVVVLGGLQVHLRRILDLSLELYYPVNQEPIAYGGPALSAWLTFPIGPGPAERRRRRAAQRPVYPVYPGYPPGYAPPGYPQPAYPPPGYQPYQPPVVPPRQSPPPSSTPLRPAPPGQPPPEEIQ